MTKQISKEQTIYSDVTLDALTDQVLDQNVVLKQSKTTDTESPSLSSKEEILFKSLKQAADYYGVCYQTVSKLLDRIPHLLIGRSIKIYKSDFEAALLTNGLWDKKKRGSR